MLFRRAASRISSRGEAPYGESVEQLTDSIDSYESRRDCTSSLMLVVLLAILRSLVLK